MTIGKCAFAVAATLSAGMAITRPSFAATHFHHSPAYDQSIPNADDSGLPIINHPGILHPTPNQSGWGNECMTDDGQGRYLPCDGASGD